MENDYELLYLSKEEPEVIEKILYEKYKKIIYSKVLKYNSSKVYFEDYMNEAKLSLYKAIENYRDETTFATYLNKCLDNSLLNYNKKINRNKNKILNEALSLDNEDIELGLYIKDERFNPETLLLEEQYYMEIKEKIINKLTWNEELVFILKEQNYTNKEISEITDNNLRTVYNIISRIRNKIAKLMSN